MRRSVSGFGRNMFGRRLRCEPLEDRRLLSVAGADDAIQMFHTQDALFAENAGQWASDDVYFGYNKGGTQIYFTDDSLEFGLSRTVEGKGDWLNLPEGPAGREAQIVPDPFSPESTQFSLSFDGARPTVPVGADMAQTRFNYHLGEQSNWVDGVATYKTVVYDGLYDGIDLHTFSRHGQMKYEFHVSPGSDYTQISLSYAGIEGLSIGDDGSLHIGTELGELVDEDLYIYQVIGGQEVEVAGRFTLLDNDSYTFTVSGQYDANIELVIDPNLDWGTYLGGSSYDVGWGIAVDASGNVLVTGQTASPGWVAVGHDLLYNGGTDAFAAKLSPTGTQLWSTYLGGSSNDYGWGIAVDASGNVLVTGYTESPGWTFGDGCDTTHNGGSDAFVAKLSPTGTQLWSTYLGGSSGDYGWGIAVDASGNVLVTGQTDSPGWTFGDGCDTTHNGGYDAFVAKLSPTGTQLWSTYLGGSSADAGWGIAVDASGNVLVTGRTNSPGWTFGDGCDTTYNGGRDAFVARISDKTAAITATKTGRMVSSWDPNHDEFIGSETAEYEDGIQLGAYVGIWPLGNQQQSKPTYTFTLPNPAIGADVYLSRIDVSITGHSNEAAGTGSGVTATIGDAGTYTYELLGDAATLTNHYSYSGGYGTDWSPLLRQENNVWYLDVTLAAIEDDDWYDLKDVTVTYTYEGLSGDDLARMDQVVRGIAQLDTFVDYHTSYYNGSLALSTAYRAYCATATHAIMKSAITSGTTAAYGLAWGAVSSMVYTGLVKPKLNDILGWPGLSDALAVGSWFNVDVRTYMSSEFNTLTNRTNAAIGGLQSLASSYYTALQDGTVSVGEMPGVNTILANIDGQLNDLNLAANYVASGLAQSYTGTPEEYEEAVADAIESYMTHLYPLHAYDYTLGSGSSHDEANSYFCEYQELLTLQVYAAPDLTVNDLTSSGVTSIVAEVGDSISVDFDVLNQGTAVAGASMAKIVWSTDSTIDLTDEELDIVSQPGLAAGVEVGESVAVIVPNDALHGQTYYIGVIADYNDQIEEFNNDNNSGGCRIVVNIPENNAPTADAGGPYAVDEGSSITLSAAGSDDPDGSIVSYDWDLDNDGNFDDDSGETVSFSRTGDGSYTVWVKVTDDDGAYDTDTATVTVNNVAPTADAGGPYVGEQGSLIQLSAAGSTDPGNDIVSYEWDLDNDGQYDDDSGVTVDYDAGAYGVFSVAVRVTDDDGAWDVDLAEVTVLAANPLPGDASRDGTVGQADAAIVGANWLMQSGAEWDDGDFNGDHRVDDIDATIMAANWGQTLPPSASASAASETPITEPEVSYDLDGSGKVDLGDLALFASVYREQPGTTTDSPYAYAADYDRSGTVDLGDLALFAANYRQSQTSSPAPQTTLTMAAAPALLPALLPGDANRDGTVDDADAGTLARNWQKQTPATWSDGDFNADGLVDDLDAAILAQHWLMTAEDMDDARDLIFAGVGGETDWASGEFDA